MMRWVGGGNEGGLGGCFLDSGFGGGSCFRYCITSRRWPISTSANLRTSDGKPSTNRYQAFLTAQVGRSLSRRYLFSSFRRPVSVHYFGPSLRIRPRPRASQPSSGIFLFRQRQAREMDIFSPVSFRFGFLLGFFFHLPLASGSDFFFVGKGGWVVFSPRGTLIFLPLSQCTVSIIPSILLL